MPVSISAAQAAYGGEGTLNKVMQRFAATRNKVINGFRKNMVRGMVAFCVSILFAADITSSPSPRPAQRIDPDIMAPLLNLVVSHQGQLSSFAVSMVAFLCLLVWSAIQPQQATQKFYPKDDIVAACLFIPGYALRHYAKLELGAHFTYELARPSTLVTIGVYQYLLHPSYTGIVMYVLGMMIFTAAPWPKGRSWYSAFFVLGVWGA